MTSAVTGLGARRATRLALGLVVLPVLALSSASCSTNPATGKQQLALMGEGQEIALGRQSDREVTETIGLLADQALQSYVSGVGQGLAAVSERAHLPWSFRVVDDPAVNAFALPGGFIYVTRGILAHLDSEAELAGVLGHEIGHVTARHSVNQISKAQLAGLGLGLGAILSPDLARLGDLAQTGVSLLFLKFSRDDERQADDLGMRYMVRRDYDPREMPGVFQMLEAVSASAGGGAMPSWLATHPDPGAREQTATARAAAMNLDPSRLREERREYLQAVDGLVFGADPREGFFRGELFLHPDLELELRFPRGWRTSNERLRVAAISPQQDALVEVTLAREASPEAATRAFLGQQGVAVNRVWSGRVNGSPAAFGSFSAYTQQGELDGLVTSILLDGRIFRLLGYGASGTWRSRGGEVEATVQSFQRLRDRTALTVQPARIEVVVVDREMSLEEFARRYPSSVPTETVALINRLAPGQRLQAAAPYKRVVGGPPA